MSFDWESLFESAGNAGGSAYVNVDSMMDSIRELERQLGRDQEKGPQGQKGRKVTEAVAREMGVRRIGVLCEVARENGWKAMIAGNTTRPGGDEWKVVMVDPRGQRFEGEWSRSGREALSTAVERVAHLL